MNNYSFTRKPDIINKQIGRDMEKGLKLVYDYSRVQGIPEIQLRVDLLRSRNLSGKILDVGIGSGDVTRMLTEVGDVTVVDSAPLLNYIYSLTLAHSRHKFHYEESSIEEAKLDYYDHVVLFGLLEHVDDPISVLKKLTLHGDKFHIVVNLANSLHRRLGVQLGIIQDVQELSQSDLDLGHKRVYLLPEIQAHVVSSGLRITYQETFYLKPLPTSMMDFPFEIHQALFELGKDSGFASYVYLEAE